MFGCKFPVFGQSRLRGYFNSPDTSSEIEIRIARFRPDNSLVPARNRPAKGRKYGLWFQQDMDAMDFSARVAVR